MKHEHALQNEEIIFQESDIKISREENGYYYDLNHSEIRVSTNDPLEITAALLKNSKWNNLKFWNLKIENKEYVNPINAIWHLTGESFWNELNIEWVDYFQDLYDLYADDLIECLSESNTFADLRDKIKTKFNLDRTYEIILSKI
jgi:hypothetical protein